MKETGKKIPISDAKKIATDHGYSQVIIHAFDRTSGRQHVTTYGKSEADCINAAQGGNTIKKMLRWDPKLCEAKPARQIKRERYNAMEGILKMLDRAIDQPSKDDRINLARLVAIAVIAQKTLNPNPKAHEPQEA